MKQNAYCVLGAFDTSLLISDPQKSIRFVSLCSTDITVLLSIPVRPPGGDDSQLSWVRAVLTECCTKTRWLVQVTTWVWALTNKMWPDRRLLLRHLRGLKKKICQQSPSTISLTLVCLFICSASSSSASHCVLRVAALPACYWLLADECSSAASNAFAL